MRVSGFFSGGSPIVKRYQVGASVATAGVPLKSRAAITNTGLIKATTTSMVGLVGLAVDTAVYSTTQLGNSSGGGGGQGQSGAAGGGAATAAAYIGVVINPDALYTARLSGGATSGTALASASNTSADATGLTVTATGLPANAMGGGTIWALTGNNVGQSRLIAGTYTGSVSAVVVVPFDYTIAVGDTFAVTPTSPFDSVTANDAFQLTSDFTEIDATVAVGSGCENIIIVEQFLRAAAENGVNDSWTVFSPGVNFQILSAATG